eukprot:TRINITY_DN16012_c0_g1_i2.p2 TRINITY_DN16012_c0_g1~~TRINITY_DN16012_c0_g1_i2.p2  ORF type:complete len:200 (+),score=23.06 TRINITY_DN16012_c0_g1_i2:244-843(+)
MKKAKTILRKLTQILSNTQWQTRLQKRGIAFFYFLGEWSMCVNKTVVGKYHVPWQDLPGYNIMLKAFFNELQKRDLQHYSEAQKQAALNLLFNEQLINYFIPIIFNKTKIHDSIGVFYAFEQVNSWFNAIIEHKKQIPANFDYIYFQKAIFLILNEDQSLCIAKALQLIYNNFLLFNYGFIQNISEQLLGKYFYKLFMH